MDVHRSALITLSIAFEFAGICLTIYAILSSSWQIVDLDNSMHEHGLWLDCILQNKNRNFTFSEFTRCYYKFDFDRNYGNFDPEYLASAEVGRHRFFGWHKAVIIILCISLCTGIFSILNGVLNLVVLCIGLCLPRLSELCSLAFTLMFAVTVLLTTIFSCTSEIVFYWFASKPQNKFIGNIDKIEQKFGFAFYLQLLASLMNLLALIFSLVAAGRVYYQWKHRRRSSAQRIYLRY
ncbi:hypothetical protein niasHT_029565 [Heterodera trifolii]|uniref:Uncharacterized protein n=1 Tax=Heterodera trifolii TaxID=157864 RepID=A0ABD2JB06_9BILA